MMSDLAKEFKAWMGTTPWMRDTMELFERIQAILDGSNCARDDAELKLLEAYREKRAWDVGSTKICLHAVCLHCGKAFDHKYDGECDDCTKPTIQERLRKQARIGLEYSIMGECVATNVIEAADEIDRLTKLVEEGEK